MPFLPEEVHGKLIIMALIRVFGWVPPLGYAPLMERPLDILRQLIWAALALVVLRGSFN